jgi:SAM-dependent methyltransferase
MPEWFEDETFWETLYAFLFPEAKFTAAEAEVDKALRLVGFSGQSVLDLACGPGRHSLALARRGYRVTGVDRSRYLLDKARALAGQGGVDVEWVEADMRSFVRPEAFDLGLSLFSSFGYFETDEDNRLVLQNLWRSLRPGGVCVLDLMGRETLARRFQPVLCHELPDGGLLVDRPLVLDDWTRVQSEWILIRGESARRFHIRLRLYSGNELKQLLSQVGFSRVHLWGDLDGNPYGADARRLVAVGWK